MCTHVDAIGHMMTSQDSRSRSVSFKHTPYLSPKAQLYLFDKINTFVDED